MKKWSPRKKKLFEEFLGRYLNELNHFFPGDIKKYYINLLSETLNILREIPPIDEIVSSSNADENEAEKHITVDRCKEINTDNNKSKVFKLKVLRLNFSL